MKRIKYPFSEFEGVFIGPHTSVYTSSSFSFGFACYFFREKKLLMMLPSYKTFTNIILLFSNEIPYTIFFCWSNVSLIKFKWPSIIFQSYESFSPFMFISTPFICFKLGGKHLFTILTCVNSHLLTPFFFIINTAIIIFKTHRIHTHVYKLSNT